MERMARHWRLLPVILLCLVVATQASATEPTRSAQSTKPNIIFIMTDDQEAASLRYMPSVENLLAKQGTTFDNALFTDPLCCPSRTTILRGQYTHNHGVTSNLAPSGGEAKFMERGLHRSTIATWLNGAGYKTSYVGKYLNQYRRTYIPPGWDRWYVQMRGNTRGLVNNNGKQEDHKGEHMDSLFANEAISYLRSDLKGQQPVFMFLGFKAPHWPGAHEKRYDSAFQDTPLPQPPNFNEADRSDKPDYVRQRPKLGPTERQRLTGYYRDRLRSIQTPDTAVRRIIGSVKEAGELKNTYFVFFTDNGFNLGNHTLQGKQTPYEETIRFPLIVRGPGVARGLHKKQLVLNNDLAPTFADLAGVSPASFVDGRSIVPLLRSTSTRSWRNAALIEGWRGVAPRYSAVRTADHIYVEYKTGERELYNLNQDPYQLKNKYKKASGTRLVKGLQSRLKALKTCARGACRTAENGT